MMRRIARQLPLLVPDVPVAPSDPLLVPAPLLEFG
jgi:hypothetical protein